jgi:hypothetical protein
VIFSNDPGTWNVNSKEFVSYFVEKGPFEYQSLNADFSLSTKYYEKDKTNRYL